MKCDNCGQEEATIHLTRVVENKMSSYHLCERCAAEQGLEEGVGGSPSAPLTDFLAQMGRPSISSRRRPRWRAKGAASPSRSSRSPGGSAARTAIAPSISI